MQGRKKLNDIMKPLLDENKKENGRKKKGEKKTMNVEQNTA
jgi:hypothetical protein